MTRFRFLITLFATHVVSVVSAAETESLRGWIPGDANSVAVVRVGEILKSPRAVREDWAKSADDAFLAGAASLPADVDVFVRGARLVPGLPGANRTIAFLLYSRPVDMQQVARHEKGTVQTIAGKPAVYSSRNAYFAQIADQVLAVVNPADRQEVARLIKTGLRGTANDVSDYLADATGRNSQIVLAMDLGDIFEPSLIQPRLAVTSTIKARKSDLNRAVELLTHLRGIRLELTIGDETDAKLTVDFSTDVAKDGDLVKALLLEILGDLGASVDALEAGQVTAQGQSVTISSRFEDEDLRRVMSLATSPHAGRTSRMENAPPGGTDGDQSLAVNRKYFKAVDQIIADLRKANNRANNYAQTAVWHERYATKIEQLPAAGVDEDLVQFGERISSDLRALASSLQGSAVDVTALQSSVVYNASVNPGGYSTGWWSTNYVTPTYNITSNLEAVREKQADAVRAGAKDRSTIWNIIGTDRIKTLDAMKKKYGADFEKPSKTAGK